MGSGVAHYPASAMEINEDRKTIFVVRRTYGAKTKDMRTRVHDLIADLGIRLQNGHGLGPQQDAACLVWGQCVDGRPASGGKTVEHILNHVVQNRKFLI